MVIKWDRLKELASRSIVQRSHNWLANSTCYYALIACIEQQITGEKRKNWRENTKDMTEKAIDIIQRWDVRKAGKLVQLFPEIVPKKYVNTIPVCDMDEKGDWCLLF